MLAPLIRLLTFASTIFQRVALAGGLSALIVKSQHLGCHRPVYCKHSTVMTYWALSSDNYDNSAFGFDEKFNKILPSTHSSSWPEGRCAQWDQGGTGSAQKALLWSTRWQPQASFGKWPLRPAHTHREPQGLPVTTFLVSGTSMGTGTSSARRQP